MSLAHEITNVMHSIMYVLQSNQINQCSTQIYATIMNTAYAEKNIVFYYSCNKDNKYHRQANICIFIFFLVRISFYYIPISFKCLPASAVFCVGDRTDTEDRRRR